MSYMECDLAVLDLVPPTAKAAGLSEAAIGWGVLRMWRWAMDEGRVDCVSEHIFTFFGKESAGMTDALETFGFLERTRPHRFRIRGMGRYFRISKDWKRAPQWGGVVGDA